MSTPLERLRHHVTGAIERGEKTAITELRALRDIAQSFRDIGRDQQDAGRVSTAADYFESARIIRDCARTIEDLKAERDALRRALSDSVQSKARRRFLVF